MKGLPRITAIMDSLKSIKTNEQFYIGESNGDIFFNFNGKKVKSLNYGNIVTKYKGLNFDSLDYKLYKLVGDSFYVVSNNGNDLLKHKDGIFFVPSPGYKIVAKFSKLAIYNAIDSVSKLSSTPDVLKFEVIP